MSTYRWLLLYKLVTAAPTHSIEIQASHFRLLPKRHEAVWTGHVRARRAGTRMTCLKLLAYYTNDQMIDQIDCQGDAEVQDGDRWARGDQAHFDSDKDTVIVTGRPQARQGSNSVTGTKVILQLGKSSMEVENARVLYKSDHRIHRGVGN